MKAKRITSINQLKQEALKRADFALLLNYGIYSRKTIKYNADAEVFSVWHHVDDTREKLPEIELKKSNIGIGIRMGAFVKMENEE